MLFNMTTLRCNNRSQSFPKLSDCPINQIRQTFIYDIMNDVTKNISHEQYCKEY